MLIQCIPRDLWVVEEAEVHTTAFTVITRRNLSRMMDPPRRTVRVFTHTTTRCTSIPKMAVHILPMAPADILSVTCRYRRIGRVKARGMARRLSKTTIAFTLPPPMFWGWGRHQVRLVHLQERICSHPLSSTMVATARPQYPHSLHPTSSALVLTSPALRQCILAHRHRSHAVPQTLLRCMRLPCHRRRRRPNL